MSLPLTLPENDWTHGMVEVFKGNATVFIQFLIITLLFAGGAFALGSDYWVFGIAVAALLVSTFVLMSLTAAFWIGIGYIWTEHIPRKYHLTPYLKKYPQRMKLGILLIFTIPFIGMVLGIFALPSDATVTAEVASTTSTISFQVLFGVFLVPLGISLIFIWWEYFNNDEPELEDE